MRNQGFPLNAAMPSRLQLATDRPAGGFPAAPVSWFHFSSSRELDHRPIGLKLGGREFVGYRTQSGRAIVLSGRCSHMGANLANGTVNGERLVCPLHGWEYGADGACGKIPAAETIPDFARQCSFPVEERGGHVFFFNHSRARFPLPFFEGMESDQLLAAQPFEMIADAPWYFIGANGFDAQHFRMAHDRVLVGEPQVSSPSPFARRIVATYEVCGNSGWDRLTRRIAGSRVTMSVTDWCGSMIFVRAELARTTSFGIFNVLPIDESRTCGRVIVWVQRSGGALGRHLFDPINGWIRRSFVRAFLQSDLPRIAGLRYQRANLIAADRLMAEYFEWLETVAEPSPLERL